MGRTAEVARLKAMFASCGGDGGEVVLIGGDAGVGKSRLISEVTAGWHGAVLHGAAQPDGAAYGPVLEILRTPAAGLRDVAAAITDPARATSPDLDRAELAGLIGDALRPLAQTTPVAVILEDLHWADAATIDLIPALAAALAGAPVLLVGTYRSTELPRAHPLRRTRTQLRRAGRLTEITLRPFSPAETADLLADELGTRPSPGLVDTIHRRSDGVAFYVTELAAALVESGNVGIRNGVAELVAESALPLPESVVDAVAVCTADLRKRHPEAVEVAAVLGPRVDLSTMADLVAAGVDDLLDAGLLCERDGGTAEFRHALVRDALYRTIPWARRRVLHRTVADYLADRAVRPEVIAEHRLSAHEPELARPLLLAAAKQRCEVHAYRDAAVYGRRAIALWPPGIDPDGRVEALAQLAECAEMSGELEPAASVWAEVAGLRIEAGDTAGAAAAQRRLSTVAGLLGDWSRATAAREAAADLFTAAGLRADAAVERLALAEHMEAASHPTQALDHAVAATEDAQAAGRLDLKAHALATQGCIRVRMGEEREGLELARSGLRLALTEEFSEAAGASYYELAGALLHAADYAGSVEAYDSASLLCREHGVSGLETACVACMSVAARLQGDWDHALAISGEVLDDEGASETVRMIAEEETGLISALRGDHRRARGPLRRAAAFGRGAEVFGIEVGARWGLAVLAGADPLETAGRQVSDLLSRCEAKENSTFALPALRWTATFLAEQADRDSLAHCHRVLAVFATQNSSPKILSALAHAGAELAMLDGDTALAGAQFSRALALLPGTTAPFEHAVTRLRHGAALLQQAQRDAAVESVTSAYHLARRLGAKPLVHSCATALAGMGEQVDRRLGRLAARTLEPAGLTHREKEVLSLVATGRTNRRIADELFLSTRTVDMHVRNLLTKLDSSTRTAAVRRATELGLLDIAPTA